MNCFWLILFLVLVLVLAKADHDTSSVRGGPLNNNNNNDNFVLNLLHVNDHHSHLEEDTMKVRLRSVAEKSRSIHYGGYPRIVTLMNEAKKKWKNVISIHAGDALVGTGYYRLFGSDPDVDMMHQVCYDIFNIGNHEYDDGDEVLADFVGKLTDRYSPCQNTRVLSANLQPGWRSPLRLLQEYGYIAPHVIINFPEGEEVAFIGVNIRNKTLTGSQPDRGTTLTDERPAVRQQIRLLEKIGINKIVLVSHLGITKDRDWMTRMEGVDAVIGAHSHSLLANQEQVNDRSPRKPYPYIVHQRQSGKKVCIGHAWKFGHGVGRLRLEFDKNGDIVNCGGSFMIPYEVDALATGEDAAALTQFLEGQGPTFVQTKEDPKALRALQYYTNQLQGRSFLDTVLIKQVEPLCNEDIPGQGRSDLCTREETKAHGGMACQLVARAMLNASGEADVAIHNAGGCRSDIVGGGDFTYGHAIELLPYADTLVSLTMKGWQIQLVLEQALEEALAETESSGSYPYASGLRFGVNASEAFGSRVSHLQLNSRLAEGTWNDIYLDKSYTVVTNSFLAAGKDGYWEFANAASRHEEKETDLSAFVSYIQQEGFIASPNSETTSTQTFVGEAPGLESDAEYPQVEGFLLVDNNHLLEDGQDDVESEAETTANMGNSGNNAEEPLPTEDSGVPTSSLPATSSLAGESQPLLPEKQSAADDEGPNTSDQGSNANDNNELSSEPASPQPGQNEPTVDKDPNRDTISEIPPTTPPADSPPIQPGENNPTIDEDPNQDPITNVPLSTPPDDWRPTEPGENNPTIDEDPNRDTITNVPLSTPPDDWRPTDPGENNPTIDEDPNRDTNTKVPLSTPPNASWPTQPDENKPTIDEDPNLETNISKLPHPPLIPDESWQTIDEDPDGGRVSNIHTDDYKPEVQAQSSSPPTSNSGDSMKPWVIAIIVVIMLIGTCAGGAVMYNSAKRSHEALDDDGDEAADKVLDGDDVEKGGADKEDQTVFLGCSRWGLPNFASRTVDRAQALQGSSAVSAALVDDAHTDDEGGEGSSTMLAAEDSCDHPLAEAATVAWGAAEDETKVSLKAPPRASAEDGDDDRNREGWNDGSELKDKTEDPKDEGKEIEKEGGDDKDEPSAPQNSPADSGEQREASKLEQQ